MNKKCNKKDSVELTKEELNILYNKQSKNEQLEFDLFIKQLNDIEELQDLISIDDYITALEPKKEVTTDSSAWKCPLTVHPWYMSEQQRCFYGDFS